MAVQLEFTDSGRAKVNASQAEQIQAAAGRCLEQFVASGGNTEDILKMDIYPDDPKGPRVVIILKDQLNEVRPAN